jgi:hypothetical protein
MSGQLTIVDYDGRALLQSALPAIVLRLDELLEASLGDGIDFRGRVGLGLGGADHGHVDC